jgi:hypothetical protein
MKTELVVISDDITGEKDAETVHFALDGTNYTIDLAPKNREKLQALLAPFVAKAERTGRVATAKPEPKGKSKSKQRSRPDIEQIRVWAKEQGIPMGDRGRIPKLVLAQYDAAQG